MTPHKYPNVTWYPRSLYSFGILKFSAHFFENKIGNLRHVIRYSKCKQTGFWPKSIRLHCQCNLISNSNEWEKFFDMISNYIMGLRECNLILFGQKPVCLHFEYRITCLMLPIFFSKEAAKSEDSNTI